MPLNSKDRSRTINYFCYRLPAPSDWRPDDHFYEHRAAIKNVAPPTLPEKTEADLSINHFQHVATEKRNKTWTLEAASARLYSARNIAELKDISVIFYRENNQNISMTANSGELNTQTHNMALSGDIIALMPPYRLTTERLNYDHHSRIIATQTPTEIKGDAQWFKADTLEYNIDSQIIRCSGNVEGAFIEKNR
ncbi:MAG: LPS export ABC transporter periplasmic protein LptC [Desulfobacterales bacterium]